MLTVYCLKKPENMVLSADNFFNIESIIPDTPMVREILEDVEQGSYVNENAFMSRTGELLPKERLSTGVKAVLNLLQHPNKILNMQEMGTNLAPYLCRVSEGSIYVPLPAYPNLDYEAHKTYSADLNRVFVSFADCISALIVELANRG